MCLLFSSCAPQYYQSLGQFLGNVTEAAIVVALDQTIEKYAPEQAAQYQESMQQLNEQSRKRAEEDNAAWKEYKEGRKAELQRELSYTSDGESREYIKQQIAELDGVSSSSANRYNTSLAGTILSEVGIKQQNIQKGMAWNDAQNQYERQNIVKEYVFDAAGEISGNPELFDKFRQIFEAQNTYLSERKKALTQEEKRAALDKRNQAYFDIGYDTYQEAQDRKSQHLAEKLQISKKLMESGWYNDPQLADEVAGSIIAVQKSDLSEQEKAILLNAYGLGDAKTVEQAVDEILAGKNNAEEVKRQAKLEKQRAEEAKRIAEQKAAEERKNALEKVVATKINGYAFDETALSDSQKSELNAVAEVLNRYSDINVLIVGHTCKIGYKNINLKKGLKRAEAGKEYLIEKGIAPERISIDSKGETQPLAQNSSKENRKQNRRIEFVIK